MTPWAWVGFLAAAGVGAPARYLLDSAVQERVGAEFPFGTVVVNTVGCFILGLLTGLGLYHGLSSTARTIIGTGGMGAFTTFSTVSYETVRLAEDESLEAAASAIVVSLLLGLAAAALGLALMAAA